MIPNLKDGDCLEVMGTLVTCSVDLLLVDLPYGITQNEWDTPLPFDKLWEHWARLVKPNGAMVLFAAQPFTSSVVSSKREWFKYDWTWRKLGKATGHLNAKKQPLRDKEDILVFYRQQCTYNPQFTAGSPFKNKAGKDHTAATSMTGSYGAYTNFREDNPGRRYPRQVIEFNRCERNTLHPTEKPVELLRYLVRTYTNPGETVLDCCMGSGSTGEACALEDRAFIGIEKDPAFFEVAKLRIERAYGCTTDRE